MDLLGLARTVVAQEVADGLRWRKINWGAGTELVAG